MNNPYTPNPNTYHSIKTRDPNKSCLTCRRHGCVLRKNWLYVCAEYKPVKAATENKLFLQSLAKRKDKSMVSKAVSIITDGMDTLGNKQEITGYYVTMTAFVIENEEYTNNIKIAMLKGIKEHYEKRISEKSLPERTSI